MSAEEDEMKEMVGGCCVCSDERGWDENPLVYCDGQGCNVAVHQACYGIVTVPSGPWYCRKCESQERSARVRCELCPSKDGALKRTDQNGWAHVVCALYIPEVRFGNVTTMEPILISLIPPERFNKTCYICEEGNKGSKSTVGACMQCNKPGCKQNFHVTCAQVLGLLCEEQGNMDNVKYCGYCQYHYGKLKASRNMKIIPPFRPVPSANNVNVESPISSPEKSGTKAISSSSLNEDPKLSAAASTGTSQRGGSTPSSVAGDNGNIAKKSISNINMGPDTDASSTTKNGKNGKKSNNGSHVGGNKTSAEVSTALKTGGSTTITPKIAQPVLTAATFSSSVTINKTTTTTAEDKAETNITGTKGKVAGKAGDTDVPVKGDDSCTIKLERVDNPLKGSSHSKKDFSSLQLKEVVTAALDRPMINTGSKFDHLTSTLTGGIDPPMSSVGSNASSTHSSGRHSLHGEKPSPPDIKPHVTLTPIPMRGATTRMSLSRVEDVDRDDKEFQKDGTKSKSPVGSTLSFHNSFGPPKLQNQTQQSSGEGESGSKAVKPADLNLPCEISLSDKTMPPAKRSRGASRDEDRDRKTPTKLRGGRRGSANPGYSKRDTSNGSFIDENSVNDDPMEGISSNSTRGGRSGPGRKPGTSRLSGRPVTEDPPAPTLSQLKSQMETSADSPLSALPPHMFGNVLNPASSMAQRLVDNLSQEMEAVVAAGAGGIPDIISAPTPLIGIPLPGKTSVGQGSTSGSTSTSVAQASGSAPPQTLEQLLERQWEQGSQFLMEQAQHLDVAQLLSCLNQLKQDNRALEEHVQSLVQRRDQLIAINARLSIPLGSSSALGQLGPGFTNVANGANHNGNGTPPPTLQPQGHLHSGGSKSLQVSSSSPSPQQHHELMIQQGRHGHRDDRAYSHSSEMQVSRAEIGIAHPVQSPHNHQNHNQRGQTVAPYGYSGHPVPVVTSHPSSHPHASHHSLPRDSSR